MRRRGDAGGVAGAARGIEADAARRQVGAQVGGEVAGGAVVGGDQQGGAAGEPAIVLQQRRQQQRPQRGRGAQADALAAVGGGEHVGGERVDALVLGGDLKKGTKAHGTQDGRIDRSGSSPQFTNAPPRPVDGPKTPDIWSFRPINIEALRLGDELELAAGPVRPLAFARTRKVCLPGFSPL